MTAKTYYVYMMASRHRSALYTGITHDLARRVYEHKTKAVQAFTSRYHADILVYFEETSDVRAAIAREKQIKGWTRAKKIALIVATNPRWKDLSAGLSGQTEVAAPFDIAVPSAPPPDSFAKMPQSATRRRRCSE